VEALGVVDGVDEDADETSCVLDVLEAPAVVAAGVAIFDMNVLALNPTEIAKPHEERFYLQIFAVGGGKGRCGRFASLAERVPPKAKPMPHQPE
jgi:hypothetical protein